MDRDVIQRAIDRPRAERRRARLGSIDRLMPPPSPGIAGAANGSAPPRRNGLLALGALFVLLLVLRRRR